MIPEVQAYVDALTNLNNLNSQLDAADQALKASLDQQLLANVNSLRDQVTAAQSAVDAAKIAMDAAITAN